MAVISGMRLDDIIAMARKGKRVKGKVALYKRPVRFMVHPEAEVAEEQEGYLLTAHYTFEVDGGDTYELEKLYIRGFPTEDFEYTKINRNIANGRLKDDYERLKEAGIEIQEERYFE